MHENKYNHYRIPAGLLITFLEKALILIHMETHLNDVLNLLPILNNTLCRMKRLKYVSNHLHC